MNVFGEDPGKRKEYPMYEGLFKYFPDALAAVAHRSYVGGKQHGHDELHWDRSKSADDKDALLRHVIEGDWDAAAWRALAVLQKEIENTTINRKKVRCIDAEYSPLTYLKEYTVISEKGGLYRLLEMNDTRPEWLKERFEEIDE